MSRVDVGRQEIMQILPHRDPFLFVDRVLELQVDEQVLAQRELREAFNTGDGAVLEYGVGAAVGLFKASQLGDTLRDAVRAVGSPEGAQVILRAPGEPALSDAFVSMAAPEAMPACMVSQPALRPISSTSITR